MSSHRNWLSASTCVFRRQQDSACHWAWQVAQWSFQKTSLNSVSCKQFFLQTVSPKHICNMSCPWTHVLFWETPPPRSQRAVSWANLRNSVQAHYWENWTFSNHWPLTVPPTAVWCSLLPPAVPITHTLSPLCCEHPCPGYSVFSPFHSLL